MGGEKRNDAMGASELELKEVCAQRVAAFVAAVSDESVATAVAESSSGGDSSSGSYGSSGSSSREPPAAPPPAGPRSTPGPPKLFKAKARAPVGATPCPFGTDADPFPKPNEAIMGSKGGRRRDGQRNCTASSFVFG